MPRAKPAASPSPWIVAALAIGLAIGLVGAGSRETTGSGRHIVGFTTSGRDGSILLRMWSDGAMEQAITLPGSPLGEVVAVGWVPVEMAPRPTNLEDLRPRLRVAQPETRP